MDTGISTRLIAVWQRFADAERANLPLWLPVAFAAGIAAWFLLPLAAQRLALAGLLAGVGLAATLIRWRVPAVIALMMLAGMGGITLRSALVAHDILEAPRFVSFRAIVVQDSARPGNRRLVLAPDAGSGLPSRVRVTLRGAGVVAGLGAGARIELKARLAPPARAAVAGGYDFARRAWFDGLGATGFAIGAPRVLAPARGGSMADIRSALSQRIRDRVPGEAGAVAAVFVTGDQNAIPPATAQAMRDAGLAHLLSISGLHIAVVVGGTVFLLRRLLGLWPWLVLRVPIRSVAVAGAAIVGIGYTLLAGAEVPTVRSIIATLIVLAGLLMGRDAFSLRLLAAAAMIILLVRPEALLGASFQLSFAAVIAIVALYESAPGRWLVTVPQDEHKLHWLARHLAALLATGLVAELALAGIGVFHFGQAGLYGIAANLLAIPLTSFVIIPALVLAMLGEALGSGLGWPLAGTAVGWLIAMADSVASVPGAVLRLPEMPVWAFAGLVTGGLWLTLWRSRARLWGLVAVMAGVVGAVTAQPPDLVVAGDGGGAALRGEDGRLALLRTRPGGFLADNWAEAMGTDDTAALRLADVPGARCSPDACVASIDRGGRRWHLLATTSREFIDRSRFEPACAAADIIISDRRLPRWCTPRWLKLDRSALERSGAVSIWLDDARIRTSADSAGDHPWRAVGQVPGPAPGPVPALGPAGQ
ncbi:ComEC/Rec2 family competence protein [Sandarakinorhabdus sp.]|uniref:ComEC/Rec2 family competence protein n=1 Tax=Sandarakinorhabdus sp. TaxID=1916663 RepID=UPI00286D8B5C|nr:ComEC/Rec2 family competence protein [Sandarakinorhabdus sp.]